MNRYSVNLEYIKFKRKNTLKCLKKKQKTIIGLYYPSKITKKKVMLSFKVMVAYVFLMILIKSKGK